MASDDPKYVTPAHKQSQKIYDPELRYIYDPTDAAQRQKAEADRERLGQTQLFPSPTPGEDVYGSYAGPAYGPGGDVYLSPQEIKDQLKYGQYFPQGALARGPGGRPMPFDFRQGARIPGMGRGGGGGGGGRAPTFGVGSLESSSVEDLRDKMVGYYEQLTGAIPDAPSLDWVTNMALGKKGAFDIRQNVYATPEFKSRYPNMPAGMQVQEYDSLVTAANAEALDISGRPIRDDELGLLFSDKGDELYDSLRKG